MSRDARMSWGWEDIEYKVAAPRRTRRSRESRRYSEDQPRDEHGRFGSGGGSDTAVKSSGGDPAIRQMLESVPTKGNAKVRNAWAAEHGPDAVAYKNLMENWGNSNGASNALREEAQKGTTEEGRTLAHFMDSAPEQPELYRGARLDATNLQPGDTISLGLSSFSSKESVAKDFGYTSAHPGGNNDVTEPATIITLEAGANGLPVGALSGQAFEHEVITGGTFQVTSVETNQWIAGYVNGVEGYPASKVTVRQI